MNDHDARTVAAWFDASEIRGSEAALDRALAAAKRTTQRPGWLVSVRGGTIATGDLRRTSLAIPLLAATALLVLLGIAVALVAGGPDLLTVLPSASSQASSGEPGPSAAPTAGPTPSPTFRPIVAGTCGTGRTVITAAPSGAPVPEEAKSLRAPEGGRLAIALEDQPTHLATITSGSIVVAGPQVGSVRVVATFTGQEILPSGGVGIFAWAASGDSLLVYAGSDDTLTADRVCGNVWVVQADGSAVTRLTDNGPAEAIDQAGFSPSGASVAYVQANVLHVLHLAGGEQTIPIGQCKFGSHRLHWAPDERKILLVCDREFVVLDRDTGTARLLPVRAYLLDAVWSPNAQSIVAATADDGGPVVILDIDGADGSTVTRSQGDHSATWLSNTGTVSPDGRWLLVRGDVDVADSGQPTYRVDTTTGRSTKLPWPVVGDSWFWNSLGGVPSVTWLEGNDRVLAAEGERLYEVDLRQLTRTEVGSVVPNQDWAVFMIPR